jgi:hypothetical protein
MEEHQAGSRLTEQLRHRPIICRDDRHNPELHLVCLGQGAGVAGKIFINYRRDDSIGTAGRLYDRLAQAFGRKKSIHGCRSHSGGG